MSRSAILSTAKKTARKSRAASRARVAAGPAIRRSQATTSEVSERLLKYTKVAVWEGALAPLRIDSVSPQHLSAFSGLNLDSSRPQAWNDVVHPLDRERGAEFFNRVETQSLPASIDLGVVDAPGSVVCFRLGVD
jgi:hypothetical protein